jgi:TRAP-type C4-dicarboxylate transport system permease small subunit
MSSTAPSSPPPAAAERALGLLSAIPVALIVVLTFVDVFGRYLFASPIRGSVEIIEYAMALLIFTALPLITRHRQHVSVGLLDGVTRGLWQRVRVSLCDAISAAALALMTWRLAVQSLADWTAGQASVVLGLPHAPLGFAMTALSAVATIVMLGLAWHSLSSKGTQP